MEKNNEFLSRRNFLKSSVKKMGLLMLMVIFIALTGCRPDEIPSPKTSSSTSKTTSKVEKPIIEVEIATATTTDFDIVFKVTSKEMPSVILHYGTTSSCNNSSTCRLYRDGYQTRFFKASHTGFAKGAKIYFYGEASNSGGSAKTSVDYRIMKR